MVKLIDKHQLLIQNYKYTHLLNEIRAKKLEINSQRRHFVLFSYQTETDKVITQKNGEVLFCDVQLLNIS